MSLAQHTPAAKAAESPSPAFMKGADTALAFLFAALCLACAARSMQEMTEIPAADAADARSAALLAHSDSMAARPQPSPP